MERRLEAVVCRPEDSQAVRAYLGGRRGAEESSQLPHRLLSLVAVHAGTSRVVGYLSVDTAPAAFDARAAAEQLAGVDAEAEGLGFTGSSAAYVQLICANGEEQDAALRVLLQGAFEAAPTLSYLLLLGHSRLQDQDPAATPEAAGLAQHFSAAARCSAGGLWLHACARQDVLPRLQVRLARVEDHDGLLPLVAAAAAGPCPSLAALPESCRPGEQFALAHLIGRQDGENAMLVAEEGGRLVGLLAATCQLDVGLLHATHDTEPFDGFVGAEAYEACEAAARQAAAAKAERRWRECTQQADGAAEQQPLPSEDDVREELLPLLQELLDAPAHPGAPPLRQQGPDGSWEAQQQQQQPPPHTLLAVTMLCMLPGYERRAEDLLAQAFAAFPGRDHVVLSLPRSQAEPPLACAMSRLMPLPGRGASATCGADAEAPLPLLLLMHRGCLLQHEAGWEVRLAAPEDVVALHGLVGSLGNALELQQSFLHALGRRGAVVATVAGELVGVATLQGAPADLPALRASFDLSADAWDDEPMGCSGGGVDGGSSAAGGCCKPERGHAVLEHCVMNPVFAKSAGALLAGALRLCGARWLHYTLRLGQAVPEWLPMLLQQRPRRTEPPSQPSSPGEGALFSFCKHMAHAPKHNVNAQIVFVGASDAALSCVERLLLHPRAAFTGLVMLAPGGVAASGGCPKHLLRRLGLEAAVTVVDGQMVALERGRRLLALADGGRLPYDRLVVATGLQDQLAAAVAGACPDAAQFVLPSQQLLGGSISPEAAAALSSVLLYGADLSALDVIVQLTDAGVPPDAITWVTPDEQQEDEMLPLLFAMAAQLRLELPAPQRAQLAELLPAADGSRATATLQAGEGGPMRLDVDLLVGCGRRGPSAATARCLRGAGLVWDGRLVVGSLFETNDPAVLGAGPAAKFSRRYTLPEVMQEHYSSAEVGAHLAESIAHGLVPAPLAAGGGEPRRWSWPLGGAAGAPLPPLQDARVASCRLPGGLVFGFACRPGAVAAPSLEPPPGGRGFLSFGGGGCAVAGEHGAAAGPAAAIVSLCTDASGVIHHAAYLGPAEGGPALTPGVGLAALVGLPLSYVAAGLSLDAGEEAPKADAAGDEPGSGVRVLQQDVLAGLAQPWAALLLRSDRFAPLREELLGAGACGSEAAGAVLGGRAAAALVRLLRRCGGGAELPEYRCRAGAVAAS